MYDLQKCGISHRIVGKSVLVTASTLDLISYGVDTMQLAAENVYLAVRKYQGYLSDRWQVWLCT
jgi:hypothetical protein